MLFAKPSSSPDAPSPDNSQRDGKGHLPGHPSVNEVLNATIDSLADHIAVIAPTGEVIAVNRAWDEFATANGYAGGGNGLGLNYCDICDVAVGEEKEDARAVSEGLRRVLSDELLEFEFGYSCHSLTEQRWYRVVVRRVRGYGGIAAIATHSLVTGQHLSDRHNAETIERAERDRSRLDAILAAIPVGAWIADASGQLTHSNPAAARIWGGSAPLVSNDDGYAVYKGWWADTGVPIADGEWALSRTVRTGEVVASRLTEIQRFDGTRGYILSTAGPMLDRDGTITGSIAISVDVTEREARVREHEKLLLSLEFERSRLSAIFEQSSSFIAVFRGPEHIVERANPAYCQLVGNRSVVGRRAVDAIPEVIGQGFVELLDRVYESGEPYVGQRVPVQLMRKAAGMLETRYVNVSYRRIADADGAYSIVEHGVDVTDEVLATEALSSSEARLRDQFAKLPGPTLLWEEHDTDFVLVDANDAAFVTFPHLNATSFGKTSLQITPGGVLDDDRRLALRQNAIVHRSLDFDVGDPIGIRSFDVTIGPQQPNRVLVHWVDTTDRRALEGQLRQAQKLEAVGQLAGGIAHDFNNLLTVIIAHTAMLLDELADTDDMHLPVVEIEQAARRASDLTRQLLTFSRKELVSTELLDLNASIREVEGLTHRLLGSDVILEMKLEDQLLPVVAGNGQIGQMLMNIVVNANDAMPNGGRIVVETARVELDESFVQQQLGSHVGPHVRLRISDTGYGMSEETRARVFEPFFTTKGLGRGTGLGLSVVYGIVQQWNGSVHIASTTDAGTAISIYLPLANASPDELKQLAISALGKASSAPLHGTPRPNLRPAPTTILLVDDDDAVRTVLARVLTSAGHGVLEASSGIDALRLLDQNDLPIDVILSDLAMPGMGGRDLAYEVRVRYPGAILVLMSGYTHQMLPPDDPLRAETRFLQKPFTPTTVLAAIEDALASRKTNAVSGVETDPLGTGGGNDRQALDALINGIDAVVWECDPRADRYHYVSRRAESLLGYPREQWHQAGFWSAIIHPDDRERAITARRRAIAAHECASSDYRLVKADGTTVWVRDVACVVSADRDARVRLGGVMFDITVAKDAMADLVRAKVSAERSDAAKSQFLKLVSHELHTPLHSIIGFSNILKKNRNGSLSEKDLSYVERIAANGERLLTIVRNVLDVTRMQAGTLEIDSIAVSISTVVSEAVRGLESAAQLKHLELRWVAPTGLRNITADPVRLRQVLTNLIDNAIKYTDAGFVEVCVRPSKDGIAPLSIDIVDTGQGIPADKLESIFTAFYQEENFTQRRHDGTGMGLGIARGLCERMGFHLTITSEVGRGTTCVIAL